MPSSPGRPTLSSPQHRRISISSNSRPPRGWKGCVTRNVRLSTRGSGAVDSVVQVRATLEGVPLGFRLALRPPLTAPLCGRGASAPVGAPRPPGRSRKPLPARSGPSRTTGTASAQRTLYGPLRRRHAARRDGVRDVGRRLVHRGADVPARERTPDAIPAARRAQHPRHRGPGRPVTRQEVSRRCSLILLIHIQFLHFLRRRGIGWLPCADPRSPPQPDGRPPGREDDPASVPLAPPSPLRRRRRGGTPPGADTREEAPPPRGVAARPVHP